MSNYNLHTKGAVFFVVQQGFTSPRDSTVGYRDWESFSFWENDAASETLARRDALNSMKRLGKPARILRVSIEKVMM